MPPIVSFVLVVHGEQAHLEECTASLLGDSGDKVQLVAVDDASTDHAPELLDELAKRDPRVRVKHLDTRVGLNAGRNQALELATGDYIWCVNATDLVAPGSLTSICRRLKAEAPDVLLVHHQRTDPLGRTRQGPHRRILARAADNGPTTLDQLPGLTAAAPRAWDKLLRRSFLEHVRFGPHGHGELNVTWPALLAADGIAATPKAVYIRRRPANAVRDELTEGSPFDIFAAYDAVFAFLDAHPEVPRERSRLVLNAMTHQQLKLLESLPDKQRRDFFHRMADGHRRHRRGDEPASKCRLATLRTKLVDGDAYRAFALLEEALDARRALHRRKAAAARLRGRATKRFRQQDERRHYRARLKQPIDPNLAVYAAYWFRGYACNPRAIYEKARELVPEVRGVWVVKADGVDDLPPGVDHVVAGTREYYDLIARAGFFVNNVNFPDHLVKRAGTVHVMTHHGTPLKRMGLDLRDHPVTGQRMDFAALLRRCERWDYSVSSNPFSTLVWERVYPTRYETLEVGYPRNDVLATATEEQVAEQRAKLGIRPDQVAILYAPTHREYQAGYTPFLDLAGVADALGDDHVVLARLHYFYGGDPVLSKLHRAGRLLDVAAHPSIEELCLAADVLVTDYSSVMFDYAVLDRPIVVHAPDWEAYRTLRGTYFDLLAEHPGVVARTQREVIDAIRGRDAWSDEARAARAAFRERFCALEDGHAAERVVRKLWPGRPAATAPPLASATR
jgi:CDP-glycerol glycerophosphotransferase